MVLASFPVLRDGETVTVTVEHDVAIERFVVDIPWLPEALPFHDAATALAQALEATGWLTAVVDRARHGLLLTTR